MCASMQYLSLLNFGVGIISKWGIINYKSVIIGWFQLDIMSTIVFTINRFKLSINAALRWYPKFFDHVNIFVGLKTFGTFIEFWLVRFKLYIQ